MVTINSVDNNSFDFLVDGENFRLNAGGSLVIEDGKIIDSIKGVVFQRDGVENAELANRIYVANKESEVLVGDNPKVFYGVKWKFDDDAIIG